MKTENRLVFGIGINDADYKVGKYENVNGKTVQVWVCDFYRKWKDMFRRCYDEEYQRNKPTYVGCNIAPEWHYFMTFRSWMENQDWEGKHLDKDLLMQGNKIYGPDSCIFVDQRVNKFINENQSVRGEWPVGAYFNKKAGKFQAQCYSVQTGKKIHLGYFIRAEEAHQAWLTFKLEQAKILASEQTDPRVAAALIARYENYGEWQ